MAEQSPQDRRAQALAEISIMEIELIDAKSRIDVLQRSLDHANDRLVLVAEERLKYRDDAFLLRAKIVELATSMANIGLLTSKATEIMTAIGPMVMPLSQEKYDSDVAARIIRSLPAGVMEGAENAVEAALRGDQPQG